MRLLVIFEKEDSHMRNERSLRGVSWDVMLASVNFEIHRDESHRLLR